MQGHAYTAAALRRPPGTASSRWSGAAGPLAVCALCLFAGALVWALASFVPAVRVRDALLLEHMSWRNHGVPHWLAGQLIHVLEPVLFTLWGIALVALALARERPRTALGVVALMAIAPLSAEVLKPLLAHPHLPAGQVQIGAASWPSGHATAAGALALSAVLVSSARLRPLVAALAAAFATAVCVSLLVRAAHMPSDVLGGLLLAGFWAALVVAAGRALERRRPSGGAAAAP